MPGLLQAQHLHTRCARCVDDLRHSRVDGLWGGTKWGGTKKGLRERLWLDAEAGAGLGLGRKWDQEQVQHNEAAAPPPPPLSMPLLQGCCSAFSVMQHHPL